MAGLYIHIPFCASRCIYCGFYSTTYSYLHNEYTDALCKEMDMRPNSSLIQTIYLGGGTPSQLSHENLLKLFTHIYKVYDVARDAEVTMECNPDDISMGMFDDLPVNRVSMGVQSFSDSRLKFLHRRHTASEADHAFEMLRGQGIINISIDLMFGFPEETLNDWESDIQHALKLAPEHISAYGLMYEDGTPLYQLLKHGKVGEIDEELSLAMYDALIDRLTMAGYEHYEISNFCKQGYRSEHNSGYWRGVPYIGLGAAAHSYDINTRSWNIADIKTYITDTMKGVLPREVEVIDDNTRYNDMVTTALRTKDGIDLNSLTPAYKQFLMDNAKPYLQDGLLVLDGHYLHLTRTGIMLSNTVMSDLLWV